MAVATYTTGLVDLALAESGTYVELTDWTAGALSSGYEADYFIQGSTCKSSSVKTTQNSIAIDVGATTVDTNGAILTWGVLFAPNSLASYALGGLRVCVGASSSNFRMWFVGGSDKNPNPYGGWQCFAINPTVNSGAATIAVNSTNRTYTRSSGDFTSNGFEPNMNIYVTGCTNAGNNGRKVIESVSATVITVTDGTGLVTESGTGDEQIRFCDGIAGTPTNTHQVMGIACYLPTAYPSKGAPFGLDAIRHGRCEMRVAAGDSGTPGNFTDMAAKNDANDATNGYNRWGLFADRGGSFLWKGLMTLGYGGAVYFVDSNKVINVEDTPAVKRAFNTISIENASSTVYLTNCVFSSLSTRSPGKLIMTASADVQLTGCLYKDMDTFTFLSTAQVIGTSFVRCKEIDSGGGIFTESKILSPSVATDSYGIYWNSATNPDGYFDNMAFIKGASSHHAITFGTSASETITLRGIDFSGFNASNAQNDSVVHILRTAGITNIQCIGCTGVVSYKTAGATVNITQGVLTEITVKDSRTKAVIVGARVLVASADDTNFPYQASVSITGAETTAIVTHTAHGLITGDKVLIYGAEEDEYNGIFTITYISSDSYSYTTTSTVQSSPATGTPKSTFVFISGVTNSSGVISDQRVLPSGDQPITGWVRMSTTSPYYQESPISDTISSASGQSITTLMIADE